MTPEYRAQLEAAGHVVADPAEFLALDEVDRIILDLRIRIADAVRRLREEQHLSQRDLAARLEVAQSRVAGIERGDKSSLDTLLRAYLIVGGQVPDFGLTRPVAKAGGRAKRPAGVASKKGGTTAPRTRKRRPTAAK